MGGRIVRKAVADPLPPLLGKLHIGKKAVSQSGKEYPVACDFFVPSGKYASLFTQAYGENPSSLLIYFPSDDPSLVCNERYEYREDCYHRIDHSYVSVFFKVILPEQNHVDRE